MINTSSAGRAAIVTTHIFYHLNSECFLGLCGEKTCMAIGNNLR